ncbi:MAG: hypothetical protein B6245_03535 [Desulfobacteraceae bacterium 4572_88]|nr:MAG: hypothetical protein B6245_03535 [Desulfobacteraceae bacterium 4572_88]RLC12448.1 MAG: hypothetical protein DRI57_17695 [Deltaproteobacteria bacterium]
MQASSAWLINIRYGEADIFALARSQSFLLAVAWPSEGAFGKQDKVFLSAFRLLELSAWGLIPWCRAARCLDSPEAIQGPSLVGYASLHPPYQTTGLVSKLRLGNHNNHPGGFCFHIPKSFDLLIVSNFSELAKKRRGTKFCAPTHKQINC